ncbi:TetR family transcriptional regulator [Shewanella gelidimarina]|uniref:TetR/AcrR family transcriptional regulator n=1 Tax=Shewanella gelidimarina TaxID=56813 RepID=UPI0020105555|nr:TetR family transcriptional regulator [Shewanella gelidimarina]MCL1059863.1 TetR family transcriptional regulator [Shewanella gelidimarina]
MLVPLTYVGRQASRSDGQSRRIEILEATLRLIVTEGVRGVRHRAVAAEAGVPLASTTYYFKDIKDLISDALTFFAEKTLWMNKALEEQSYELLNNMAQVSQSLSKEALQALIVESLAEFLCGHIREQLTHPDDRILENAFHEEALRNPQLATSITLLDETLLQSIKTFFSALGSQTAYEDAHQILAIIRLLEYQFLLRKRVDEVVLKSVVETMVSHIVRAIKNPS